MILQVIRCFVEGLVVSAACFYGGAWIGDYLFDHGYNLDDGNGGMGVVALAILLLMMIGRPEWTQFQDHLLTSLFRS